MNEEIRGRPKTAFGAAVLGIIRGKEKKGRSNRQTNGAASKRKYKAPSDQDNGESR